MLTSVVDSNNDNNNNNTVHFRVLANNDLLQTNTKKH
jgi:hypothetical protein